MGFEDFYRQVVRLSVSDDNMMSIPSYLVVKTRKSGALTIEMPKSGILTIISNDGTQGPSPPPGSGRPPAGRALYIADRTGLEEGPAASEARAGWPDWNP